MNSRVGASLTCRSPADLLGALNEVERRCAPAQLYLAGDVGLLERGPRVAVIGSRKASPEGLRRATAFARALVVHDIVVVSGLAAGIDTAAHQAAIVAGGRTIAVLGTPLDRSFPQDNRELQRRLMLEQLVVSQFPVGSAVTPKNFPIRNRTMALLTHATVIVEAAEKSGTVVQAWEALRLGRLLLLMENVANDPGLSWPRAMIHAGARVLSRDNLREVLSGIPGVSGGVSRELAQSVS